MLLINWVIEVVFCVCMYLYLYRKGMYIVFEVKTIRDIDNICFVFI